MGGENELQTFDFATEIIGCAKSGAAIRRLRAGHLWFLTRGSGGANAFRVRSFSCVPSLAWV